MKKRNSQIKALIFTFFSPKAHSAGPIRWQCKIEKESDARYLFTFEAAIMKDWHLYAQSTPKGGPLPLEILFSGNEHCFTTVGKAIESPTTTEYSEIFGVNETFFIDRAIIRQAVQVASPLIQYGKVELNYQVCKEICIPQRVGFEFDLSSLRAQQVIREK